MYAPVVTRFESYSIPVQPGSRAYMNAVLAQPDFIAWRDAALKETWTIDDYDAGHVAVETFR